MEILAAQNNKSIVFIYEAFGTCMLLYAINLQVGETFGQFGIAFMLFACLLIGGPITGAHYNPAVTVGVYISNTHWREDFGMFCLTIFAQVFGAFIGILLAWSSLYNNSGSVATIDQTPYGHVPLTSTAILLPSQPGVALHNAFQIEMICTFIFVMINLLVKTGKTSPTNDGFLSCLAVAFTLLAMICVAGSKTGACLNPAVGIAQTIYEVILFGNNTPGTSYSPD